MEKKKRLKAEDNPYLPEYIAQEKSRERRLKKMDFYVAEELKRLAPESADRYTVVHKPIAKTFSGKPIGGGYPISVAHNPNYYSFYLVSNDTGKEEEIMQIPPKAADKKLDITKTTAYFRLQVYIPKAIELLQKASQKRKRDNRTNKKDIGGLEQSLTIISGIGILGALFFLSSNLTGNVISNLTQTSSNIIGGALFFVGLIGTFFYFRKKK